MMRRTIQAMMSQFVRRIILLQRALSTRPVATRLLQRARHRCLQASVRAALLPARLVTGNDGARELACIKVLSLKNTKALFPTKKSVWFVQRALKLCIKMQMYRYVLIHVHIVFMYICTHTCSHANIFVCRLCLCVYAHTHIHVQIYVCVDFVCEYIHTHIYTCKYICV